MSNPRRPNQVEQTGVKEAHVFDDSLKGGRNTEQVNTAGAYCKRWAFNLFVGVEFS